MTVLLAALVTMTTALAGSPASATSTARESLTLAAAPTPGQHYQMQVVRSGLRLEVAFASTGFAPIIQGPGAPSYRPSNWRFDAVSGGFFRIVNRNSGKCIDAGAPSVRLVINQSTCGIGVFDQWTLTPIGSSTDTFKVTSRTSGLSLCIIGNLTFAAVPLVSDTDNQGSCDKRFKLLPVN